METRPERRPRVATLDPCFDGVVASRTKGIIKDVAERPLLRIRNTVALNLRIILLSKKPKC